MSSSIGSVRCAFSIVVPSYNEAPTIATVLARVVAAADAFAAGDSYEIVVVDDGSSDSTHEIVRGFAERSDRVRVVAHERNRGLEAAIRSGVAAVAADVLVLLDADLSYAPDLIGPLIRSLRDRGAAAVLASPYMAGGRVANVPRGRLVASRGANALLSFCVDGTLKTLTGMVRAYDTATLRAVLAKPSRGEFNTWVVAELLASGGRVVEIPAALEWPMERFLGAPRLSFAALRRRTGQVVASIVALRAGYVRGRSRSSGT